MDGERAWRRRRVRHRILGRQLWPGRTRMRARWRTRGIDFLSRREHSCCITRWWRVSVRSSRRQTLSHIAICGTLVVVCLLVSGACLTNVVLSHKLVVRSKIFYKILLIMSWRKCMATNLWMVFHIPFIFHYRARYWLGLQKIGTWKWTDGNPTVFTKWKSNNPVSGHDCAYITGDGLWTSDRCTELYLILCKRGMPTPSQVAWQSVNIT